MPTEEKTIVQGGAHFKGAQTKKHLKDLIKDRPGAVALFDTSAFGSKFSGKASELPRSMEFLVVGPNAYHERNWYATVYWGRNGLSVK